MSRLPPARVVQPAAPEHVHRPLALWRRPVARTSEVGQSAATVGQAATARRGGGGGGAFPVPLGSQAQGAELDLHPAETRLSPMPTLHTRQHTCRGQASRPSTHALLCDCDDDILALKIVLRWRTASKLQRKVHISLQSISIGMINYAHVSTHAVSVQWIIVGSADERRKENR